MSDTLVRIVGMALGWGLIAVGALLMLRALLADRSRGRRRCPRCWYSMEGVPGMTCPECGRTARKERRFFRTRRRWRRAVVSALLPFIGLGVLYASGAIRLGWAKAVPSSVLVALCPIKLGDWDGTNSGPAVISLGSGLNTSGDVLLSSSFPAIVLSAPPPTPTPTTWRDEVVAELRRRVDEDSLWGWQAAILAARIRHAAAIAGRTICVLDFREALDLNPRRRAASGGGTRGLLELLLCTFPFPDDDTGLRSAIWLARGNPPNPRSSLLHRPTMDAPTIVGPFLIAWTSRSIADFQPLLAAMKTAAPGMPAAFDPADWSTRLSFLDRAGSTQVTTSNDQRIEQVFLDIARQSGLTISVDWGSLAAVNVTNTFHVQTLFETTGSVADLLDRCLAAAAFERGGHFHWSIGPRGIEVGNPQGSTLSVDVPTSPITRVYDVRNLTAGSYYCWEVPTMEFNGRLIISADVSTHLAFEKYLTSLSSNR